MMLTLRDDNLTKSYWESIRIVKIEKPVYKQKNKNIHIFQNDLAFQKLVLWMFRSSSSENIKTNESSIVLAMSLTKGGGGSLLFLPKEIIKEIKISSLIN